MRFQVGDSVEDVFWGPARVLEIRDQEYVIQFPDGDVVIVGDHDLV